MGYGELIAFVLKNWKWVAMAVMTVVIAVLISLVRLNSKRAYEAELNSQRYFSSLSDLSREAGKFSQKVDLSLKEIKRIPQLDSMLREQAKELGIKNKQIDYLMRIKGKTVYRDCVIVYRDTQYIDGEPVDFVTIPVKWGCSDGKVRWQVGSDTALVEGVSKTDLSITGYREHSKGWLGRDMGRFFTFRWKLLGSDKWDSKVLVVNKCDTIQKWEQNLILNVKQK
jgi:hypothetical protein